MSAPSNLPRRPLRVGLIGAGYIADWHCEALRHSAGVKAVAVADISESRAAALAEGHGLEKAYDSAEEMLADARLDAVHVLTPPPHHLSAAATCLAAGAHTLLEKPACATLAECEELVEFANKSPAQVGVNHNFLYQPIYRSLKEDLRKGLLGRVDSLSIVWNKPLPQIAHGPFDAWMLREPGNVILETGPHSVGHLLDLAGVPDRITVLANDRVSLPRGRSTYRHWGVSAICGHIAVQMHFSFAPGFSEHYLHVRGSHGVAIVDFESNTYTLQRATRHSLDFDRYARLRATGASLRRQATGNLVSYAASKAGLSRDGNAYGVGIRESVKAFYARVAGGHAVERQHSPDFARDVMELCEQIVERADTTGDAPAHESKPSAAAARPAEPAGDGAAPRPTLVLGGTGFIGQELIRQLVASGRQVRMLCRNPSGVPDEFLRPEIEVCRGDLRNADQTREALAGVGTVYHLARPHVKTWSDYRAQDVAPTESLAQACLQHGVDRLIYTGTIDSYYAGAGMRVITEKTPLDPQIDRRNLYARSKAYSERALLELQSRDGLPLVIFRPGIVVGRGSSPFHWGVGMWTGESCCQLWGSGKNYLPFVLVEDVAAGLVAALERPGIDGRSYNLVAMPCLTGLGYLENLERAIGARIDAIPTSPVSFYANDMFKWGVKTLVRHPERRLPSYSDWKSRTQLSCFNSTKAREELDWAPVDDAPTLVERGIVEPARQLYDQTVSPADTGVIPAALARW